jgi:hypothetical protein
MTESETPDPDAERVAQEIMGAKLPELTPEQIFVRDQLHQKHQADLEAFRLERELEAWQAEADRQEQEQLRAEAEAQQEHATRMAAQREAAERVARESRERAALRAAEMAAAQSQQTRDRLARLEAQEIQRQRNAAVTATLQRLGDALVPPAPPEPTVIVVEPEEPYDPSRRFKFDWQP